jgi:hypothetical protein
MVFVTEYEPALTVLGIDGCFGIVYDRLQNVGLAQAVLGDFRRVRHFGSPFPRGISIQA